MMRRGVEGKGSVFALSWVVGALCASAVAAAACAAAAAAEDGQAPVANIKLSLANRNIFCGRAEEASREYGIAVNAEITWRMAAGAHTPAEALAAMRAEYCSNAHRTEAAK